MRRFQRRLGYQTREEECGVCRLVASCRALGATLTQNFVVCSAETSGVRLRRTMRTLGTHSLDPKRVSWLREAVFRLPAPQPLGAFISLSFFPNPIQSSLVRPCAPGCGTKAISVDPRLNVSSQTKLRPASFPKLLCPLQPYMTTSLSVSLCFSILS
jgi:hypothetical protein